MTSTPLTTHSESPEALYLYAIFQDAVPTLQDALAGLKGATPGPPRQLDIAGRTVIVGAHDGGEILQTRRRMLAHTHILETAMSHAPLLPMRFGHVAQSPDDLATLLEHHSAAIDAQFERLGNNVEVGLRVSFPRSAALEALILEDPTLAAHRDRLTGRGAEAHFDRIELGRRVAEQLDRRRTSAQHLLVSALTKQCASHILRAPEEDVEILRAECLIAPDDIGSLGNWADTAARASGFAPDAEPEVRLVGPVPPYHFVNLALSAPEVPAWA